MGFHAVLRIGTSAQGSVGISRLIATVTLVVCDENIQDLSSITIIFYQKHKLKIVCFVSILASCAAEVFKIASR